MQNPYHPRFGRTITTVNLNSPDDNFEPPRPLVLVVGFLGAGKTKFLRDLVPLLSAQGLRTDLVINDYENAAVDASTFAGLTDQVLPISGSCVCCDSRDQLISTLMNLRSPGPGLVLVEANGTTDVPALLEVLANAPYLNHLTYPVQVAIVDGQRWQERAFLNPLERAQVATATHILVSRGDIVAQDRLSQVEQSVKDVNPHALRITTAGFAKDLLALTTAAATWTSRGEGVSSPGLAGPDLVTLGGRLTHGAHHFSSFQMVIPGPVDRTKFLAFMDALGPEVLRVKGLVRLRENPEALWMFHKVEQHTEIAPRPLAQADEGDGIAIFIGVSLAAAAIRDGLHTLSLP